MDFAKQKLGKEINLGLGFLVDVFVVISNGFSSLGFYLLA